MTIPHDTPGRRGYPIISSLSTIWVEIWLHKDIAWMSWVASICMVFMLFFLCFVSFSSFLSPTPFSSSLLSPSFSLYQTSSLRSTTHYALLMSLSCFSIVFPSFSLLFPLLHEHQLRLGKVSSHRFVHGLLIAQYLLMQPVVAWFFHAFNRSMWSILWLT